MSGRLDAFFSLTLCHALVACILFAGALSLYAPMAVSYYQLISIAALLYWVLVLFILTILSTTIQLVMRMVRIGSGEVLQRYRRVGVMLANPRPPAVTPGHQSGRRPTPYNVTPYNNSSNSNVPWSERLLRLTHLSRQNNSNNNKNSNALATGEFVAPAGTVVGSGLIRSLQSTIQGRSLLRRHPYITGRPTTTAPDRCFAFNESSSVSSLLSSQKEKISKRGLSLAPAQSRASSALCSCNASDAEQDESHCLLSEHSCCSDAEPLDTAAEFNTNNNNDNKPDNNTNFVSVTVESSAHVNTTSNAGQNEQNYSSNAGGEDAPRASRQSSAAGGNRKSSVIDQIVGRVSQSSVVQAIAAPRGSSADVRRSSAARQSDARRSSAGQEARRSSTRELSIADRKSSTDARRSSAEPRRSSADENRKSSTRESESHAARRSSGRSLGGRMAEDDHERRHYRRGIEASEEAARRSYAARMSDVEGVRRGVGIINGVPPQEVAPGIRDDFVCCDPVPAAPCESCCRESVKRNTCWCRCPGEIHDPKLLDDCCGSRDGRLLSLPGFPRSKAQCNSCFTPCKPLPELCGRAPPECDSKCRFSSKRECSCACPCAKEKMCADKDESTGVIGGLLSKLGANRSQSAARRSSNDRASFTSSFKSIFSRGGSSAGNVSRNNPTLSFSSAPFSSPTRNFNMSHSSAFDVYWSNFWDNIVPDQASTGLPLTFENVPLPELKTFTGHLVESIVAKLKAEHTQPQNNSSNSPRKATPSSNPMQEEDIEAVCRDILREIMSCDNRKSTTRPTKKTKKKRTKPYDKKPTTVEPIEPVESVARVEGSKDVTDSEDAENAEEEQEEEEDEEGKEEDVRTDLLLDDGSLREFAGGVVEGLYTAMRRKLQDSESGKDADENYNCSNVIADADGEIRAQVLPVVVDQIVCMIKDELRRSGGDVKQAADQYIDAIVTNAVLNVRGRLDVRQREANKAFVVVSNDPTSQLNDNRSNSCWSQQARQLSVSYASSRRRREPSSCSDDDDDDEEDGRCPIPEDDESELSVVPSYYEEKDTPTEPGGCVSPPTSCDDTAQSPRVNVDRDTGPVRDKGRRARDDCSDDETPLFICSCCQSPVGAKREPKKSRPVRQKDRNQDRRSRGYTERKDSSRKSCPSRGYTERKDICRKSCPRSPCDRKQKKEQPCRKVKLKELACECVCCPPKQKPKKRQKKECPRHQVVVCCANNNDDDDNDDDDDDDDDDDCDDDNDDDDDVGKWLKRRNNESIETYLIRSILLLGSLANQSNSSEGDGMSCKPCVVRVVEQAVESIMRAHSPPRSNNYCTHNDDGQADGKPGESTITAWLRSPVPGRSRFTSTTGGRYSGNPSTYSYAQDSMLCWSPLSLNCSCNCSYNSTQAAVGGWVEAKHDQNNSAAFKDWVNGRPPAHRTYRSNRSDRERFATRVPRRTTGPGNFNMHSNRPDDATIKYSADSPPPPRSPELNTNNSRRENKMSKNVTPDSVNSKTQDAPNPNDEKSTGTAVPSHNNTNSNNNSCLDIGKTDGSNCYDAMAISEDECILIDELDNANNNNTRRPSATGSPHGRRSSGLVYEQLAKTPRSRSRLARRSTAALKAVSCSALQADAFLRQLDSERLQPDVELLSCVLDEYRNVLGLGDHDARRSVKTYPAAWRLAQLPAGQWVVGEVLKHAKVCLSNILAVKPSKYCRGRRMSALGLSLLGGVDDNLTTRLVGSVSAELEHVVLQRAIVSVVRTLVNMTSFRHRHRYQHQQSNWRRLNVNNNTNDNSSATVRFDDEPQYRYSDFPAEDDRRQSSVSSVPLVPDSDFDDPLPSSLPPRPSAAYEFDPAIPPPLDLYSLSQVLGGPTPQQTPRSFTGALLGVFMLALVLVLMCVFGVGYVVLGARLDPATAWTWLSGALVVFVVHAVIFDPIRILCVAFYWTVYRHQLLP